MNVREQSATSTCTICIVSSNLVCARVNSEIFLREARSSSCPCTRQYIALGRCIIPHCDFYLSKERWDEANEIYEELETIGGFEGESAEYYQKFGYALQKRKKYAEAIQA